MNPAKSNYEELRKAYEKLKGRRIYVYEKRIALKTKAEKWGVAKLRGRPKNVPLLISGTGRSGTTSMSVALMKSGIDVRHEQVGSAGTSTHFFHSDSDWYPFFPWNKGAAHIGERKSDFVFEAQVHVVRDPLRCIGSMMTMFAGLDLEFLQDTGLIPMEVGMRPKLHWCMHTYYAVNKAYQETADAVCKIEDTEKTWKCITKVLGSSISWPGIAPQRRGTGYKTPKKLSYRDLENEDRILTRNISSMARKYGY